MKKTPSISRAGSALRRGVPEGFQAISICAAQQEAPLRICVLVRQPADPVAGPFVQLRSPVAAAVYLGCITDAGGAVRDWVELWLQNLDGLQESYPTYRDNVSNHILDERWQRQAQAWHELDPDGTIQTGWETTNPQPTLLDVARQVPVHLADPVSGEPWALCRDDALLVAAGLPPYTTSLTRYLYQPAQAAKTRFVPVVPGSPENDATVALAAVLGAATTLVPFNTQAGRLLVCRFCPLAYEEYVDLLGGKSWTGLEHGKRKFALDEGYRSLENWPAVRESGAHLFLGRHGRSGRFVEMFHLKLQLLLEAFRAVRAQVQQEQLPFLNLSAESFRVHLGQLGQGLPFLWTARCCLVNPGGACALPVETSKARYFVRGGKAGTSIYLPDGLGLPLQGTSTIRLRKVLPPEADGIVVEGTLVTQERLVVSPNDLIWIQLPLSTGRLDLYGHLYSAEGLAAGEARFRTVAQRLPEPVNALLRASEGIAFPRSPFEIIPLMSTPCDLYALGVLAVRSLLVNERTTLAQALDETLSLARQAAVGAEAKSPLAARLDPILRQDPRWLAALGPHRLTRDPLEPADAARLLPPELWRDTLALLIRLFPGLGPDSFCRDHGDVPTLALETTFEQPIAALEDLVRRTRSLIVIDWTMNREINATIQSCLRQL